NPTQHSFPTRRSSDLIAEQIYGHDSAIRAQGMLAALIKFYRFAHRPLGLRIVKVDHQCYVTSNIMGFLYPHGRINMVNIRAVIRSEEHTSELQSRENL